jgi:hypothetical protein
MSVLRQLRDRLLLKWIVNRQNRGYGVGWRRRWRRPTEIGLAGTFTMLVLLIAIESMPWQKLVSWTGGLIAGQAAPRDGLTGHASVIDGDTLDIRGTRIRLWGVDAPETAQLCQRDGQPWQCGRAAANALAEWIGERIAICEQKDIDRYKRI